MGQSFIACDRDQSFLMPPDVREWLPPGHLAWFVLDSVAAMDLEAFYGAYRRDGRSRPAYEPAMMVALLLYAYSRGMRSSRAIERACEEDVAFRVIAAQLKPDHATIARFVERHEGALGAVMSCPSSYGPARVAERGCAKPSASSMSSASAKRGRLRATVPSASTKPGGAWRRSSGPRLERTLLMSATARTAG